MILLKFTGMCEGCYQADLSMTKYEAGNGECEWFINCRHRPACLRMFEKQREAEGRPKDE